MKHLAVTILWIGIFLFALSLAFAFDGDYFWWGVAITSPFTTGGIFLTAKIYKK